LQAKRKYEAALRNAKIQSWKQYYNATKTTNLWNIVYKVATCKIKSSSILSTLQRPDGTVTSDMEETINFLLDYFTLADEEEADNYHR
jgi:hypothetical protein